MKGISQLINFNEVLSENPEVRADSVLHRLLQAACEAANAVRKLIRFSSTHPSANQYDQATYDEVSDQIDEMRRDYDRECYRLKAGADKSQRILDIWSQHIERVGKGDCPEYAMLTLKKLQTLYPDLTAEIFALEKVDSSQDEDAHEFVVLGRDPDSESEDYSTWGEAVICDAWLGEVFLAKDIPEKLKCFRPYLQNERQINDLGSFDPRQHYLTLDFKIEKPVGVVRKRETLDADKATFFSVGQEQEKSEMFLSETANEEGEPAQKKKKGQPTGS
jgi:hypothetical protein